MHLNSILKGSSLCVKTFQPITTIVNKDNHKTFQVSNVSAHIGLLRYLDSEEILLKGQRVDQLRVNRYTAT